MAMVSLSEYAKINGRDASTVRHKAIKGGFKTAQKIGRNWVIDENELYGDLRVKSGEFKGWRKNKSGDPKAMMCSHYGVDVVVQVSTGGFRMALIEDGIEYKELPTDGNFVLTYGTPGNRCFAVLETIYDGDSEKEKIYLTKEVPVDGDWERLIKDVRGQLEFGENPMKLKSRVKKIIEEVETLNLKEADIFDPEWNTTTEEQYEKIVLALKRDGYTRYLIRHSGCDDVDKDFLNRLIELF